MPFVSLIIPVYNAEKYLRRCLTSAMEQTFKDMEILVVNDGSTDESLASAGNMHRWTRAFTSLIKKIPVFLTAATAPSRSAKGDYLQFMGPVRTG